MSNPHALNCSVPQGSVLGPLQFVSYTENLDEVIHSNQFNRYMYSDDTQLIRPTHISRV